MNSHQWFEVARNCIPGGVSSPVRSFKHVGGDPIYFESAKGAELVDVDGKRYVDFCLSFGPHILGHSHPAVISAIRKQSELGTSFGACHPGEVELAELILKAYPAYERVRLVNSGTEAVMTAVRLARGVTARSKILVFEGCYHGHSDSLLAKAGSGVAALAESSSKGVPEAIVSETIVVRLDDWDTIENAFRQFGSEIAAVMVEPVPANYGLFIPGKEFLAKLVEIAHKHGSLVIFDEVISGFRVGLSGATGLYGVLPDLVTLGKVIGGGLPLAAVAGPSRIMDHLAPAGPVYQAGTLSGNALCAATGIAVLKELFAIPPYAALEDRTAAFASRLQEILAKRYAVKVTSIASLFWIQLGDIAEGFPPTVSASSASEYGKFFREALGKGVYFPPSPYEVAFLSTAHTSEILSSVLSRLG